MVKKPKPVRKPIYLNRTNNGHLNRYLIAVGASATLFLIWERSLEQALDELGEYCREHAPGLTCTDEFESERSAAESDGYDSVKSYDIASADRFNSGDSNQWFQSDQVMHLETNPTKAVIATYCR